VADSQKLTVEEAERRLREAGYEALEPYPGVVTKPWRLRCVECKYPWTKTLNHADRTRCNHRRRTPERAVSDLRAAGFEALEAYPGKSTVHWRMRCAACKRPVRRTMSSALVHPCVCVTKREKAERELRAAGYEPLVPFPGDTRKPWPSRCIECGQRRRPNLTTLRQGKRCKHVTPEDHVPDWARRGSRNSPNGGSE
jgi:hypothetical protein